MTGSTHLAAGLIIGYLTGDYVTAVACSVLIDADHVIAFAQAGILSRPKKIWQSMLRRGEGKIHNQRNYLHSVFALIVLSAIVLLINLPVGIVFAIAYAVHLGLDMLDSADYYPLFPNKSVNIQGPIGYCSKQEFIFAGILYLIRILLILTSSKF